jgi:hypothetical protein
MKRAATLATWLLPPLSCLAVYWPGLIAWFQWDDFWWLSQRHLIATGVGFWKVVLSPTLHGTFRPIPEQLFFILFGKLFGFRAVPYRLVVLVTQCGALAVLGSLARRLTGSRLAAVLAPILWMVHASLTMPMVWTSSYNQVLASLLLIAELRLFIWHADTGRVWAYGLECALFVIGFGVLETNAVHPAHALAWALLLGPRERRRALCLRTLPLFALSAIYIIAHLTLIPRLREYNLTLEPAAVVRALWRYWAFTVVPNRYSFSGVARWQSALTVAALLGLAAHAVGRARRGDRRPLFYCAFYLIALAPVLPLVTHVADYLLTVPVIAIGLYLADALATSSGRARTVAAMVVAAYLCWMTPASSSGTYHLSVDSLAVRNVVGGVISLRRERPDAPILIDNVSEGVYDHAMGSRPFTCLGMPNIFLTDRTIAQLHPASWLKPPSEYAADPPSLRRWRFEGSLIVLSAANDQLVDITDQWQ